MKTRRAEAAIKYNGKGIKTTLEDFNEGFSYEDNADGKSDNISITLGDPLGHWISAWIPQKGDQLEAVINVYDWDKEDDNSSLECGTFTIDDMSYSSGTTATFTISAVSVPADDAFMETPNSRAWENVTLKQVAETLANKYKLELVFDAEDIPIASKEQNKKTDSEFLQNLCSDYNYSLKVYNYKIIIFDREIYKKKDSVATIGIEEIENLNWNTTIAGTYTGAIISYTNPKKGGKNIEYSVGGGTRILKINNTAASLAEAQKRAEAELKKANHSMTTISFTTKGRTDIVAGQCIDIVGIGQANGKYYVDKKSDRISSGGYTSSFSCSLVEKTDRAVLDAIDRLVVVGVILSPEYWRQNYKAVEYLDMLLINMATRIRRRTHFGNISPYMTTEEAIVKLTAEGIMNSPDYWLSHVNDLAYLDMLIRNAAEAI